MGQILIVHGSDPRMARSVFASALRLFATHGAARPDATFDAGATVLAHFPRRSASAPASLVPAAGQARGAASPVWSLAAGCWLCNGRADVATQAQLGEALAAGPDAWRQASAALDGFFAIAAGDAGGRAVHVATDRTGTLHLYRTRVDACEVLSTSALVLGALAGADFDPVAVREFLGTGSVFEERSLFAGVEKLAPGAVLRFRDGRLVERQAWWELRPLLWAGAEAAYSGGVAALAEALTAALDRLLAAYPGAVLDLTGGFDTRALLGAALATGRPFGTVVTGPEGNGDVVAADRIARECALRHTHLRPGIDYGTRRLDDLRDALALTDGEFNVVEYANVAQIQSRLAGAADAGGLTVNGSSGELCRGYWWGLLPSLDAPGRAFDARRVAARCFADDGWADTMLSRRLGETRTVDDQATPSLTDHFTGVVERATANLRDLPGVALIDTVYLVLRMQRWAGRLVSSTDRLWPCVSPFMLERPIRAMLSAPPDLRRRDRMARLLIEHLNPALAALPMADGSPALPIRLGTVHRVGPYRVALGAREAWRRAQRKLGMQGRRNRAATAVGDGVARVRADPAVAALLRPESMLTCALYDPDALAAFVQAAQRPGFGESSAFGRVLTLELVARAVVGAE